MCRDRRYSEDLWHGRIKKDQKNTVVWQIMTWTWKFRIPTGFCLIWMRWRFFAWKSPLDLGVPYFLGKPKWRLGVLAISLQIRIRSRKKKHCRTMALDMAGSSGRFEWHHPYCVDPSRPGSFMTKVGAGWAARSPGMMVSGNWELAAGDPWWLCLKIGYQLPMVYHHFPPYIIKFAIRVCIFSIDRFWINHDKPRGKS